MPTEIALRGRGRPRQFDSDEVLDHLVDLFWEQGYEATSMSDIVEATGLNKSSLYNSFGSKEELFGLAVDRYLMVRAATLQGVLQNGTSGLDDLFSFLSSGRQQLSGPMGTRGCLLVNSMTELGNRDESMTGMSADYRDLIRTCARAALDRAAASGEISADLAGHYAEMVVAFLLSLSVFARGGADESEIDGQFAAFRSMIESWRTAS